MNKTWQQLYNEHGISHDFVFPKVSEKEEGYRVEKNGIFHDVYRRDLVFGVNITHEHRFECEKTAQLHCYLMNIECGFITKQHE